MKKSSKEGDYMFSKEFGHYVENLLCNIAYLRKRHGFSKKKMAEILNIGVWSIDRIEEGVLPERLKVDVVFEIEKYFGIHPAELFECKLENIHNLSTNELLYKMKCCK